ncbi:hypothetical protein [Mycetocola saprophilus]|uniref:hypothetical protein n=1 Tax=Mycetocola saprophilus TaxID=76636 RepID=UPI0004BF4FC5|nr:hypothetical protein [Mycetocola saprophilus]
MSRLLPAHPARLLAAVTVLGLGMLGLTACSGNNEEAFNTYRHGIEQVPGLTHFESGLSRAVPLVPTGRIQVELPADRGVYDALVAATCGKDRGIATTFEYTMTGEHTAFTVQDFPCTTQKFDPLKLVAAADSVGKKSTVSIGNLSPGLAPSPTSSDQQFTQRVRLDTGNDPAATFSLFAAIAPQLPDNTLEIEGDHLRASTESAAEVTTLASDLAALNETVPLLSARFADTLTLDTVSEPDSAGIVAFLTTRSPDLYRDHPVISRIGVPDTAVAPPTDAALALQTWLNNTLGLTGGVTENTLTLRLANVDEVDTVSRQIAEHGTDLVGVVMITPASGVGVPEFVSLPNTIRPGASPGDNPFPVLTERFRALAHTEQVRRVEAGRGSLRVWLLPSAVGDESASESVRAIMRGIAEEGALTTVWLDDVPLDGYR